MMPATFLGHLGPSSRIERATPELRAYLDAEWHMGFPELLAQVRQNSRPRPSRLRRWLRAGRTARRTEAVPEADDGMLPGGAAGVAFPAVGCDHPAAERLGFSGATAFLRCVLCNSVFVAVDGRRWTLTPATSTSRSAIP